MAPMPQVNEFACKFEQSGAILKFGRPGNEFHGEFCGRDVRPEGMRNGSGRGERQTPLFTKTAAALLRVSSQSQVTPVPSKTTNNCFAQVLSTSGRSEAGTLSQEQLMACVDVGKAITAELDPNKLIATIMEKVSKLLPSETWSLLLLDEKTQSLRFEISVDLDPAMVKDFRLPVGQGVAGQAALQQRLLIVEDVSRCEFFDHRVDKTSGLQTRSLICVPILFGKRTLGVLEVVNPKNTNVTILSLLNLLADYLAIAIENTRRYRQMQEMADRDNLTGLYNQRYMYLALERNIALCRNTGCPLSLIFMDMDDFKQVVDTLGHLNGSRALHEVAQRVKACLSEPAFGVAYGGDEFLIVLPDINRRQATETAHAIRRSVKNGPYLASFGHQVLLTASFGVATFPDDAEDLTDLLALADKAMFNAKHTGKDSVHMGFGR